MKDWLNRLEHRLYCQAFGGLVNAAAIVLGRLPLWHPLTDLPSLRNSPGDDQSKAERRGPRNRLYRARLELASWLHGNPPLCPHLPPWQLRLYGQSHEPWRPFQGLSRLEHALVCRFWYPLLSLLAWAGVLQVPDGTVLRVTWETIRGGAWVKDPLGPRLSPRRVRRAFELWYKERAFRDRAMCPHRARAAEWTAPIAMGKFGHLVSMN